MLHSLLFLASLALQTQRTQPFRVSVPIHDVGTTVSFQLPQFDPDLGTLVKIEAWTDFTLTKNNAVEALCSCATQECVSFDDPGSFYSAVIRFPSPLFTFVSEDDESPEPQSICAMGPFDGTDDFMGPSSTVGPTQTTIHHGVPYSYPLKNFSDFIGYGSVDLDLWSNGVDYSHVDDNPNCPKGADWEVQNAQMSDTCHIRYTYIPY